MAISPQTPVISFLTFLDQRIDAECSGKTFLFQREGDRSVDLRQESRFHYPENAGTVRQ